MTAVGMPLSMELGPGVIKSCGSGFSLSAMHMIGHHIAPYAGDGGGMRAAPQPQPVPTLESFIKPPTV